MSSKNTIMKLILKTIFAVLFIGQITMAQIWTTGLSMPEVVRAGNTATHSVGTNNYMYVVGGRNSSGSITTKNYRYHLNSNTWEDLAPHPAGVLSCGTAILKDTLYTIGGVSDSPTHSTRRMYKYNIPQNTWSLGALFPVGGIIDCESVAYQDSLIYIVGGFGSNKVRVYNARKKTWRNATSILPIGQTISWGSLAVKGNKLVYMCGADSFLSPNYSNTVRIGTIDQNDRSIITWTTTSPFPGLTRSFFDTYEWQDGLIMTGGSTDNTFNAPSDECYHYNVDTNLWTQLPPKPTAWLTGNSGSFKLANEWQLVCTAGYNNAYIDPTEIFSSGLLSTNTFTNDIKIFLSPNPVSDVLSIKTAANIEKFNIYNLLGEKITSSFITEINLSDLSSGVYILESVSTNKESLKTKFFKK